MPNTFTDIGKQTVVDRIYESFTYKMKKLPV